MKLYVELTKDQWLDVLIGLDCRIRELAEMETFLLPGSLTKATHMYLIDISTDIKEQLHV
jgi:hypothetical protein